MDTYITRLCWNENRWKKPSGSAAKLENGTFNVRFGFGFEEWLFSSRFEINNWRYGFVQGVNKSQKRLAGHDISLLLYTIAPNRQRYFVGEIQHCQVLTPSEADTAHSLLEKNGLINQMIEDVLAVRGNADFIKDKSYIHKWTLDVINIRYQPQHLLLYRELINIPEYSRVWNYSRYQLIRANEERIEEWIRDARSRAIV